ncbi:MAG: hypothetical protein EZS28_032937 [Streblomastix strix]|uniref:Tyr recombinase domain-containing protein n=1 Tax=Streblomastix strix TaxID=222440 RepID=A0A5J4ULL2_9EUKA|nr:MAG: hypothetical protein EZS28_032937 [Streblomastix strix]
MAWFVSQLKIPKCVFDKQLCIKMVQQLIFDLDPMRDTPSALIQRAISNCNVQSRKYAHVWDIDILFNRGVTQSTDQMLINQDPRVKFASLLLSFCFLRITEISEVDFILSKINLIEVTALQTLETNATNVFEQYKV